MATPAIFPTPSVPASAMHIPPSGENARARPAGSQRRTQASERTDGTHTMQANRKIPAHSKNK
ncbi:MAG: hypothetical protein L6V84_07965 [Oscillospiraceae bacterium]|nr:MAG: hypothetical protein L6V84_07965 [Oscillospiraceae bacterium]